MPDISSSLSKREVNARQNTYTKSEIDLKDGAIQAIAEAAQTTADAAEKKNQEQDQLIAELQKSAHTHSNKGVLDKIEQPYTTAERDKLAGLENYTHPNYTAHAKGFYKFANDGEGHVADAEDVTKSDLYNAGGVIQSELSFYDYIGYIPLSFMTLFYGGGLKNIAEIWFDRRNDNKQRKMRLTLGSWNDKSTGCLNLVDYNGCQYILEPNPDSPGAQVYGFYLPKQSGTLALTKDIPDISGKLDKTGDASSTTASFAAASSRENVKTGEKMSVLFGKIAKWFTDLKAVAFSGSYKDLSDKPTIPDISGKQDKLTAGANVKISGNVISAKDTTYSNVSTTAAGLMTAADKKKLDGMDLSKYLPLHGTADQSKALSNGSMRYGWCVNSAANANSGYRWFRIGTMTASKNGYDTETLYMHICNGNNIYGVIGVYTRTDSIGTGIENMRVSWLVRDSSPHHAQFKLVGIASSTGVKFELWCYTSARWYQTAYYVIADLVLTGGLSNRWVLETHGDGDAKNATTVGTTSVTDVDLSYAAKAKEADTLTDSGWVDVSNFKADISSFSQITTSFRKYGDIVFIRGRVQPKSNMTSISLCSTTSTSLTGITPNHPVKGVGVSTDGLTPFMVNITTSPANSVILKGSFSANKIYDFEFSYIK